MDSSLTFYLILGALLLGFIVLGMLKGMIKMLLFGAAVLSSVAAYFWLSKYGFTYLSFITSDPREWMVTVLSVGGAAAVFFVFMHGLFWFSDVFSWGRRMGFGGAKGIVTTVLMAAVVCWVGVMCIFFYGSMAEMTRARELALYHMDPNRTISLPAIYSIKKSIMDNPHLSWLEKYLRSMIRNGFPWQNDRLPGDAQSGALRPAAHPAGLLYAPFPHYQPRAKPEKPERRPRHPPSGAEGGYAGII